LKPIFQGHQFLDLAHSDNGVLWPSGQSYVSILHGEHWISNVDISESVIVRKAILSALNLFLERFETYIAELSYSSKCNLLSEYCGQKV